jgi:hypothetical protein
MDADKTAGWGRLLAPKINWPMYGLLVVISLAFLVVVEYPWATWGQWALATGLTAGAGLTAAVLLGRSMGHRVRARRMAEQFYNQWRQMRTGPHEFRPVPESELLSLEREYFAAHQPWFESQQFRHVADLRNLTGNPHWPSYRLVHRNLLSADGTVRVTLDQEVTQLSNTSTECGTQRIFLTTELSDGQFVTTSRSRTAAGQEVKQDDMRVPQALEEHLSVDCPDEHLLRTHGQRVERLGLEGSGAEPVALHSAEGIIASVGRMQLLFNQHARPIDLAHEMRNNADHTPKQARFMRLVAEEMERLQACQKCGYNLTGTKAPTCPECAALIHRP